MCRAETLSIMTLQDKEPRLELSIKNLEALNRLNNASIPTAMSQNILILGAGELGLSVLEGLSRHPKRQHQRITVLTRQATSTQPPRRRGSSSSIFGPSTPGPKQVTLQLPA
ncbi:hypothetical protein NXS19_011392 [Fusarium pseudograminearum]|nr:hypothetical protein NXS19_011392 [Fusarium pseudograminearum]